jgi:hypothetical protein
MVYKYIAISVGMFLIACSWIEMKFHPSKYAGIPAIRGNNFLQSLNRQIIKCGVTPLYYCMAI